MKTTMEYWEPLDAQLLYRDALHLEVAFKALADWRRLKMLSYLMTDEYIPIYDFQTEELSHSHVSYHLNKLHSADLVERVRSGRHMFYSSNYPALQRLSAALAGEKTWSD